MLLRFHMPAILRLELGAGSFVAQATRSPDMTSKPPSRSHNKHNEPGLSGRKPQQPSPAQEKH